MVSVWEIAIKSGLGKVGLSVPFATFLDTAINGYGLIVLSITTDDCVRYEALPFHDRQHRDPFDRISSRTPCAVRAEMGRETLAKTCERQ